MMNEAAIWCELGNLYIKVKEFDEAISAFKHAIALEPTSAWYHNCLGIAHFHLGHYEPAQRLFEKGMQLSEDDAEKSVILKWLAASFLQLKKYRRAALTYETADLFGALDSDAEGRPASENRPFRDFPPFPQPEDSAPAMDMREALPGIRRLAEELLPADKHSAPRVENLNPKAASPTQNQQTDLEEVVMPAFNGKTKAHENSDAAPPLTKLTQKDTKEEEMPETSKEIAAYKTLVKANPRSDRAWFTLGNMYKAHGRLAEAAQAFKNASEISPRSYVYHYNLGMVLAAQAKYAEAETAFKQVLVLKPEYALAHGALAGCYRRMNLQELAEQHIAIAEPLMRSESSYNRACFESICGNIDKAFELLIESLESGDTTKDWIACDPDLDGIRKDARFQSLILV